ncbi:MAG: YhbP family protein [Enterobacteriaceae bacterium]|nr:YhbP family protein [Enterobacteriaceae bacterium]
MTSDPERSRKVISHYLNKNHVVALCTSGNINGEPDLWCANCFYLFDPQAMGLIMMSQPHTRHCQLALSSPQVAGTIAAQTKNVALIQGVQFRGQLQLLAGEDAADAKSRYVQRFPAARLLSAPLWLLRLDEIKMTDNKLGFGKKFYWQREYD